MACHSTEGASEQLADLPESGLPSQWNPDQGHLERLTTTTKYYFII